MTGPTCLALSNGARRLEPSIESEGKSRSPSIVVFIRIMREVVIPIHPHFKYIPRLKNPKGYLSCPILLTWSPLLQHPITYPWFCIFFNFRPLKMQNANIGANKGNENDRHWGTWPHIFNIHFQTWLKHNTQLSFSLIASFLYHNQLIMV